MPLLEADGTPTSFIQGGVLTLDLGGTVGWAYGLLTEPRPIARSIRLPPIGGEGCRYCALSNELAKLLEATGAVHMVIEAPLPLPALITSNAHAVHQQLGLRAIARCEAYRASCSVSEIDAPTVRFEVLGQRWFSKNTVKREVVGYCRSIGLKVSDHHAGDASLLWIWHVRRMKGTLPVAGPLFRENASCLSMHRRSGDQSPVMSGQKSQVSGELEAKAAHAENSSRAFVSHTNNQLAIGGSSSEAGRRNAA